MCRTTFSLALLLLCSAAQADDPPEKIKLDYHRDAGKPPAIRGYDDHYANLFDSVNSSGKKWTGLVRVSGPRHGVVVFPAPKNEEILPVFGTLYRVDGAELIRLKDAPKGLAIAKDSFVIPLRRDGQGSGQTTYRDGANMYSKTVFVMSIEKGVAKIKLDDIRGEAREVRKGDVVKLGPNEWEVRAVVPADEGAIGWVELGQKGK